MPDPSPQLHSRHHDACDDSRTFSELPRRAVTPAPDNEPRGRKMNIRKLLESLPERERDMERDSGADCKLYARKGYDRRSGRPVMVFKRTRPNRKKQPCGMPNCPTCGIFWRMDIEDLERRVPGLVSEQAVPKQSLRKKVCAPPAPSTTGSTTSSLTQFTEISEISRELLGQAFDSGLPTPSSTRSRATYYDSPATSIQSTPTKPPKNSDPYEPLALPSPSSSSPLAGLVKGSTLFKGEHPPAPPSVSALTGLTMRSRGSSIFKKSAPSVVASSSAMSTLTDFSELETRSSLSTPPSSLSSVPPTLPSATTINTTRSAYKIIKVRKHRSMTKMSDGSEWMLPTLERVQAYITSQGERRLARSTRKVVAVRAENGSTVAVKYEKAIWKADLKAGRKPQTREEVLNPEEEDGEEDGEEEE